MVGQLEHKSMHQKQSALSTEMRQLGERSPFDAVQQQTSASSHKSDARFKLNARPDSMQFDLEAPTGRHNRTIDADLEVKGVGTKHSSLFHKTVQGVHDIFSDWMGQNRSKANSAKRQQSGGVLNQSFDQPSEDSLPKTGSRAQRHKNKGAGSRQLNDPLRSKDHLQQQRNVAQQAQQLRDQQEIAGASPSNPSVALTDLSHLNNKQSQQPSLASQMPKGTEVKLDAKPDSIQFDLETSWPINGSQTPVDIDLNIQGIGTRNPQTFAGTFREINNLVSNMLGANPQNIDNSKILTTPEAGRTQPDQLSLQPFPNSQFVELKGSTLGSTETITNNSSIDRKAQPLIGVIDSGFAPDQHGDQVRDVIAKTNPNAEFKLAEGVGQGKWAENLSQFVETAKASSRPAVANLSFDLSNVNPDGSVVTRKELTTAETNALAAAQKAGIPVVVSAGNQGESSHAWEQAAKQFDNVIVTGAFDGIGRAPYSSYGVGLDLLALGQKADTSLTGTSLAAAETTATVANMLSANPDLKAPEVEKILKATATVPDLFKVAENPYAKVKPGLNSDSKTENGSGLINPGAAFEQAAALEKMEAEVTAKTGLPDEQISIKAVEADTSSESLPGQIGVGGPYTPNYNITLATPQKNYQFKASYSGKFEQIGEQKQSNQPTAGGSSLLPQPQPADPNQAISGEKPGKPDPVEPPKGGSTEPKQALLDSAKSYLNVREQGGNNRGTEVEKIQRSAGGKPGDAWCMEFVQHVVKDIEAKTGARSNINRSNRCLTVWEKTPTENRLSRPEPGSLVVWKNHVGIVTSVAPDGKSFKTIEGNTTNPNNKNEQGVFEKDRKLGQLEPGNPLLGFVKVF